MDSRTVNVPASGGTTVTGSIVDQASGSPIPGLRFRLVDAAGTAAVELSGLRSDLSGRFSVDLPAEAFTAGAALHLEVLDPQGNSIQRMGQPLTIGSTAQVDLAISVPSDGPVARQAALGQEGVALVAHYQATLTRQAAELDARERIAGIYFDRAIAETQAALQELKSAAPPVWSPWAVNFGGSNDPNRGPSG
jgi:hypothetical protein